MALLLGLALLLLVATAILAASALPLSGSTVSLGLAGYVLGWTEVVLVTQALSLPRAVRAAGYLVAAAVLFAAALAAWHLRGRPRPPLPRFDLPAAARRHPLVAALALVAVAALCYEAFLVFSAPPNNADSMSYRLSRAAFWLQHGGIYWIPDAHTARQNELPGNAELGILSTFAFVHRDTVAALPQLVAQCALVSAVFGCARRLGWDRPAALFAALVAAMPTQVALQSVSTQNDLVAASFVAAAAYFLRSERTVELALAGLAIGLAFGTKTTALLVLPALVLLAIVSLRPRALTIAAACACAGFALLAGPWFVRDLAQTGKPLGHGPEVAEFEPQVTAVGTISTVARVLYRFVDMSGFRVRTSWLDPVADTGDAVFDALHIPTDPPESAGAPFSFGVNVGAHEDHSFFGPLGFLVILPLAFAFSAGWLLRRTTAPRAVHGFSLPIALVVLALTWRFSDEGRFLIPVVALVLPLVAWVYRRTVLAGAVAVLAAATLLFAHAFNALKPTGLAGTTPVWRLNRAEAMGLDAPLIGAMFAAFGRRVPEDARLGYLVGPYGLDYPLWGPELDRRVVPLPERGLLTAADRRRVDWIFLSGDKRVPPLGGRWAVTRFGRTATLLRRQGS